MQPFDPEANREGAGELSGVQAFAVIRKKERAMPNLAILNIIKKICELDRVLVQVFSMFPN